MKAVTTILAIGLLITFVQEFVAAENSTCDFNLPDRIKVYNDFVKKMAKHRRLQQKTVVYFAFISGFRKRMDMLRQTWLRPVAESSMMAYGFFVDPGTSMSELNNQTYGDIHMLQTSRDPKRKRMGGGVNIDDIGQTLEVTDFVLNTFAPQYIAYVDDDIFLCVPSVLKTALALPKLGVVITSSVWMKNVAAGAFHPDGNFFFVSADMARHIASEARRRRWTQHWKDGFNWITRVSQLQYSDPNLPPFLVHPRIEHWHMSGAKAWKEKVLPALAELASLQDKSSLRAILPRTQVCRHFLGLHAIKDMHMLCRIFTAASSKWKGHRVPPVALPIASEWLKCVGLSDDRLKNAHANFFQSKGIMGHSALVPHRLTQKQNEILFVPAFNYTCDKLTSTHPLATS